MTDINELFARDPLSLTDTDVDEIISEMRKRRHLFNEAPTKAVAAKSLTKGQAEAAKLDIDLNL